jgi:metal-dependent amidase/aminoacylase/carboxypeptidase family protein
LVYCILGVKAALDHVSGNLGHLVVMGTPGEEGGGGKILMLDAGCFDNVDFSMMVHPAPFDALYTPFLANQKVFVTFKGGAARAAAFPWEGKNALDAAVLSYNAISMLRQQMQPAWRAHGVFTDGGTVPGIIPETSQLHYFFRCPTLKDLEVLKEKADHCFRGAAEATGECYTVCIKKKEKIKLSLLRTRFNYNNKVNF